MKTITNSTIIKFSGLLCEQNPNRIGLMFYNRSSKSVLVYINDSDQPSFELGSKGFAEFENIFAKVKYSIKDEADVSCTEFFN